MRSFTFLFQSASIPIRKLAHMKKYNPIRNTVTYYVTACKKRVKRPKMTLIEFFEDLENRGHSIEDSLYEKWTKKIRADMKKAGTWKENPSNDFDFVAEYVSRLHRIFKATKQPLFINEIVRGRVVSRKFSFEALAFRMIYLKIRVWGLRTKRFRLMRWRKRHLYPFVMYEAIIWPLDFRKKKDAGEKTFRYIISHYLYEPYFKKEIIKEKIIQT